MNDKAAVDRLKLEPRSSSIERRIHIRNPVCCRRAGNRACALTRSMQLIEFENEIAGQRIGLGDDAVGLSAGPQEAAKLA